MAARRLDRRQGFLISATVHLMILTLLGRAMETSVPPQVPAPAPVASGAEPHRAVLISPAELQRIRQADPASLPPRVRGAAPERDPLVALPPAVPLLASPTPPPTPAPPVRDRASTGAFQAQVPSILRPDRDLASASASRPGRPGPTATPLPPGADKSTAGEEQQTALEQPPARRSTGRLGPGSGATVQGPGTQPQPHEGGGRPGVSKAEPGQRSASGPNQQRSITRSLEELNRRLGDMGSDGMSGAVGVQMGSIFYDPQGADFTGWINHFKNEVYRNWIVPQAALFGFRGGHVDMEFWVHRDGRLSGVRMLKSSGTPALDRAARNSLIGSRLIPLPDDYAPPSIRFQVTFFYGEPKG
jgi:periplasmic protein TonB